MTGAATSRANRVLPEAVVSLADGACAALRVRAGTATDCDTCTTDELVDEDEEDEDDEDDARANVAAEAPGDCVSTATGAAASRASMALASGNFFSAMTSFLGRPGGSEEANTRALVTF